MALLRQLQSGIQGLIERFDQLDSLAQARESAADVIVGADQTTDTTLAADITRMALQLEEAQAAWSKLWQGKPQTQVGFPMNPLHMFTVGQSGNISSRWQSELTRGREVLNRASLLVNSE